MMPALNNNVVEELDAILAPCAVRIKRTAESRDSDDIQFRSKAIPTVGQGAPGACLKAKLINRSRGKDDRVRSRELVVFRKGGSARADVIQFLRIESLTAQSCIGERKPGIHRMACSDVGQFPCGFRFIGADSKTSRLNRPYREVGS